MKKTGYVQVKNDGWVVVPDGCTLLMQSYYGKLIHEVRLRKRNGRVEMRFVRHERATISAAALRRKRKVVE